MKFLLSLFLLSIALSATAQDGLPGQPYIYVQGKAEIEKAPDMVTLQFTLTARNADQAKANAEVQAKATKILSLLDDRKIDQKNVIAADLTSDPEYEREENSDRGRGKLIGYNVKRTFSAKLTDLTLLQKLVDDLLAVNGLEMSGIAGGLVHENELEDTVAEKALTNARENAEKTLKPLNMKVGAVFAVSPVPFPRIRVEIFGDGYATAAEVTPAEMRMPDPAHYRLAPVTVSREVHVIFLISAANQ